MKSSNQILGLPVLSIEEGKQIGKVKKLIPNPKQGTVDYLLIEDDFFYLGLKALQFEMVQGIGEFALTVDNSSSLLPVGECKGAVDLLGKKLRIPGLKVMSNKGRLVGTVSEYFVDENTGAIAGCQLIPLNGDRPAGIIPREFILTYGSDFLVVEDGVEDILITELPEGSIPFEKTGAVAGIHEAYPENGQNEALKHFEEQQRLYLLGKKISVRIVSDSGEVIAEEGDTITDEIIERAKQADRYIQLTLNIRE